MRERIHARATASTDCRPFISRWPAPRIGARLVGTISTHGRNPVAVHKGKHQVRAKSVARGRISARATWASLAAAGVFFIITAFPALAYHPGHGGDEASGGGASYDAILPIVVGVVIFMAGVVLWGRKQPKRKSKTRGKMRMGLQMKPKRVKRKKRRR